MKENKTITAIFAILTVGVFFWNVWHFALGGRLGADDQDEIVLIEKDEELGVDGKAEYANECSLKFVADYVVSGKKQDYNSKGSLDCKCRVYDQDGEAEYFNESFVINNAETIRGKDCAELCAELCPTIK